MDRLIYLRDLPVWVINLIISMLTTTVTEVVSNTATANILLPILKEMSLTLCQNPTYLGKIIVLFVLCSTWLSLFIDFSMSLIFHTLFGTRIPTHDLLVVIHVITVDHSYQKNVTKHQLYL